VRDWFVVIAVAQCVAWLPILWRFVRNWSDRHNPVSLAICSLVLLAAYVGAAPFWLTSHVDISWVAGAVSLLNLLVCLNFYAAFGWSRRKFKDDRKN
jgi:hypothetical protein